MMWTKRELFLLVSVSSVIGLFLGYMIAMIQVQAFVQNIIESQLNISPVLMDEIVNKLMARLGIF